MTDILYRQGFLGTPASFGADLSLIVTTLAVILVTIGWRLAVRRRYGIHHRVQLAATLLNAVVAVFWMIRSFVRSVLPLLPEGLADAPVAVTAAHALTGSVGLLLGGTIFLRYSGSAPQRLRRLDAKRTMRIAFILYVLSWLLGVAVYVAFYTQLVT